MKRLIALTASLVLLSGCASSQLIQEAVNHPARSAEDRELDDKRKPAEVLTFFQIKPGMNVLDVFGGGGYYTEIMSYLVGAGGSVTLYNNNPWNNFVNQQVSARLQDNRLPNVTALTVEPAELKNHDAQYDAAIFILGMHDIYYEDEANGWPAINVPGFLGDIARLVKPGGVLGIIDHNAAEGTVAAVVGKSLHRVHPARVIVDLTAAGFTLEAESDVLANTADDHSMPVFDPSMRWKTDRSVLRFRR